MSENYDQRHQPERWQLPHDEYGIALEGTDWEDRPDHNQYYPDIAVPLELENGFSIAANKSQAIWADIYIGKDKPAGTYTGTVEVRDDGVLVDSVPVELTVYDFTLPDDPTSKTMMVYGPGDMNNRYLGEYWPSDAGLLAESAAIIDKHFQMAHRHKISLIDSDMDYDNNRPADAWIDRLDGSLFSEEQGYRGPGEDFGNNVYSIGTYSQWYWQEGGEEAMRFYTDAWEGWFQENFPEVERFLYLIDESSDYEQIEQWAQWIENNPGVGSDLLSMATMFAISAYENTPSLDVPTNPGIIGDTDPVQSAVDYYNSRDDKRIFYYNGGRPAQGSFMIDDDGIALRTVPWAQFKKGIDRWFFWQSTYYNNYQAGEGETNVFQDAQTFGGDTYFDDQNGRSGWNYSNGDGVMFYPGTDTQFPADSYGIDGPIASLRLKYWRRGIQDADYLALAMAENPAATQAIIDEIIPQVLWEYGVAFPEDPTWVRTEVSWSDDPDVWEDARRRLAEIIEG